uniref:pectin lyase n=1 Tax=Clastoptera arizonana TaxID=38151 RepID=A0A1B6DFR5_9HEMI
MINQIDLKLLLFILWMTSNVSAFYKVPNHSPFNWISRIVIPTTNEELTNVLCSTYDSSGYCTDSETKIIILTKIFDFTKSEGSITEEGCYHLSTPECLARGQKKLNVNNQCSGLKKVTITYDKAGIKPLNVGSNKYVISRNGGLRGKGLKICKSQNVFINGLSITDINAGLIWGGDALSLDGATNVWIHGNYFSRIGRQMIVSHYNPSQNITISYNEFDGRTPYSAYCDGLHYWLWLFEGAGDTITLYNNFVHHTAGRGGHVTGLPNSKVLLHVIKNKFSDVQHAGLIEAYDPTARILIEGNLYNNVSYIVSKNGGHIYYPFTKNDAATCKQYIGRECYMNGVIKSGGLDFKSDVSVLKELSSYSLINTDHIDKFELLCRKFKIKKSNSKAQG